MIRDVSTDVFFKRTSYSFDHKMKRGGYGKTYKGGGGEQFHFLFITFSFVICI
jgi:hypothetical protein